jgi:hypothetical protein
VTAALREMHSGAACWRWRTDRSSAVTGARLTSSKCDESSRIGDRHAGYEGDPHSSGCVPGSRAGCRKR